MTPAEIGRPAGRGPRWALAGLAVDVIAPLAVFYGLRAAGVGAWVALLCGLAVPLARLTASVARERRVNQASLLTLALILVGTTVGLLTGDPRLLLARESYLTAVAGLWILASLWTATPLLFRATLALTPPETAEQWRRDYECDPRFRQVWRVMTVGWALAFLVDAAARVAMAYTLPVDVVPLAGTVLLAVLLVAAVQGTKAYARRRLTTPEPSPG